MIDLEDLRRKAEAATPGEWSAALHFGPKGFNVYPEYGLECGVRVCHVGRAVDAKYIAAANPATILALIAEIDRCHARLEIDHVYRVVDGEEVREDVAYADRGDVPDGIECRAETIKMLEERATELKLYLDRATELYTDLCRSNMRNEVWRRPVRSPR